jgi:hypothetical protein
MTNDIRKFELAWRWTDPKYTVFPDSTVKKLIPLDNKVASDIDKKIRTFYDGPKLKRKLLYSWQRYDAENSCSSFLEGLEIIDETIIILSWDIDTALKTNWSVFRTYWDDFCYPVSDDLTILPEDESWLLAYFHEQVFEYGKIR